MTTIDNLKNPSWYPFENSAQLVPEPVDIQIGLERNEFDLFYQPQVDLRNGTIVGAEALIRWHRPGHGIVLPSFFISTAERSGLIVPMGEWVLKTACSHAKSWCASGKDIKVAVNVSPRQFVDQNFTSYVEKTITSSGINPARLEIEITESIGIRDLAGTVSLFNDLKSIGLRLAVDDFGVGFSSLNYIKSLPFDTVKIDRCFTQGIMDDKFAKAVVKTIIAMSRSLELEIIAEGVESIVQADALRQWDCDHGQGYHFGMPLPHADFTKLLKQESL